MCVDLSVLTGSPTARDMGSYAELVRSITIDLTDLNPERFSLVYGDERRMQMHELVLRPMVGPRVLYLNKPDGEPEWLAANLHLILMSFGKFAWAEAVKANWSEVYEGLWQIQQDPRWSREQFRERNPKRWQKFEALERGLMLLQEMQGATFALLAMGNLVRIYGDHLPGGGYVFLREAVRWILSDWGCAPALAFWLCQKEGDLRSLSGLLRDTPREGLMQVRKMLRDASRGGDARSLARAIDDLSLTQVLGIELHAPMYFTDSGIEDVDESLEVSVRGFQMLTMRPSELTNLLNRALVYGRT